MKIGMILDSAYPDDARVTNECTELLKNKHEIHLFCLCFKKPFVKNEVINQINVHRYHCSKFTYKLSALANDIGLYGFILKNKIRNFVENSDVEVLHVHDIQIAKAAISVSKRFGIKYNIDLHENRPEIMKYYKHVNSFLGKIFISPLRWKKAEESFVEKANKIVVVTENAKEELLSRVKIDQEKIVVYPNTVRDDFYKNKKIDKVLEKQYSKNFVITYVGNTSERRGLLTVIESLKTLRKTIPNIKLLIIGKSSFDYVLKKEIKKYDVEELVDFIGWVKENKIPNYLSISKLGLSPLHRNIHHDTTYANKIFQYISFGCPVVSSDVIAQSELVKKHNIGVVFEDRNVMDLTKKITQLYNEKDLFEKFRANCIESIKKLNNSVISNQLISIYE